MENSVYETHVPKNPLLPFIFHGSLQVKQRRMVPNWHENIELLYCIEGRGEVHCGTEVFAFVPGDIIAVDADTVHFTGSDSAVRYHCLIIDAGFCGSNGIPASKLRFQKKIRDANLTAAFDAVVRAYASYDQTAICAVADIRYAVLGLLRQLCSGYVTGCSTEGKAGAHEYIKKALSYIRTNLSQDISLDALAQYVGISKYHLAREFKAFTGRTVISTVNLLRCAEAKRRIEGGAAVSDAARSCGFENLSYFTRTFKKHFGTCPSSCAGKRKTEI